MPDVVFDRAVRHIARVCAHFALCAGCGEVARRTALDRSGMCGAAACRLRSFKATMTVRQPH